MPDRTSSPSGITIIENLLAPDEQREVLAFLSTPGWQYGWTSREGAGTSSFLHKHFAGAIDRADARSRQELGAPLDCASELAAQAPLLHAFWTKLNRTVFPQHVLSRCYANGLPYGCDGAVHTDSLRPGAYTAVYYPHFDWHPDWGGETVLFNEDSTDILTAIYPKPNRLLVFPGFANHVARGVSRVCPHMRITLMFKVELI